MTSDESRRFEPENLLIQMNNENRESTEDSLADGEIDDNRLVDSWLQWTVFTVRFELPDWEDEKQQKTGDDRRV